MDGLSVIFDLDGTLVDTAPDLLAAANRTLNAHDIDAVDDAIIRNYVGHGSKPMLRAALRHLGYRMSERELDSMSDRFVAFYSEAIAARSRPFPGLVRALEMLREGGALLGVCTNKREALSQKLLGELDLRHFFGALVGADTLTVRKPDPAPLLEAVARIGGDPARAVLIGDSETDAKTARNASIPFIAVSFGYHDGPIEDLQADAVIGHFDQLIQTLEIFRQE